MNRMPQENFLMQSCIPNGNACETEKAIAHLICSVEERVKLRPFRVELESPFQAPVVDSKDVFYRTHLIL